MIVCLDTSAEASAWASRPGRSVLALFVLQIAVNQASRRIGAADPRLENLLGLAAFAALAGAALRHNLRAVQATWGEALLAPAGAPLGAPALRLLLSFYNATFSARVGVASGADDVARARATAGALLLKKLIVRCCCLR